MPLLRSKEAFPLAETPVELSQEEMVFQVRFTKEIIRDYEDYVRRMNLYRQKVWTCKATGRDNMTYERALVSEYRAAQKIDFPKEFMGPVLHLVQFSRLEISELVEHIYSALIDMFIVGEEVSARKGTGDEEVFKCRILKVLEQDPEVEDAGSNGQKIAEGDSREGNTWTSQKRMQYEVAWLDRDGRITEKGNEDSANLLKRALPFTREGLKKFILESAHAEATLDVPWLVRDKLARKFKIPLEPPGTEKQVRSRQDPSQRQVNQAYFDDDILDDLEAEYNMRKRNNKRQRDCSGSKPWKPRKGHLFDDPFSELLDDNLLEHKPGDAPLVERPIPSSDFEVRPECVGKLLMVWDFCNSFAKVLQLSPFSLHDFEKAIQYKDAEPSLLSETFFSLFRVLLNEPGVRQRLAQRRKKKVQFSMETWKVDLSDYMELEGPDHVKPYMQAVRSCTYWQLDASAKLEILEELIERVLNTAAIRAQLDENIEEQESLDAQKADDALLVSKMRSTRFVDEVHEEGCLIGWLKKGKRKSIAMNQNRPSKREYSARCLYFNGSRTIFRCNRVELHGEENSSHDESQTEVLQERMDRHNRELERCFVRTSPLGKDRSYNRYWFFHREGRVFVESEDSTRWGFYSGKKELDDFCKSLNTRGARECDLKTQLDKAYSRIRCSC